MFFRGGDVPLVRLARNSGYDLSNMRLSSVLSALIGLSFLLVAPGMAQRAPAARRVPGHQTYERITVIVPIIGSGTAADPKRPMFAPTPVEHSQARVSAASARQRPAGIIGYSFHPSDDGKWAIVEFVARDKAAFQPIAAAARNTPGIKAFDREKNSKEEIEIEARKIKKDFDLSKLSPRMR